MRRYYGLSAGVALLALSYASVPLYKMVSSSSFLTSPFNRSLLSRYANRLAGPVNP